MPRITPRGASIRGVEHHLVTISGTDVHYVSAGTNGSPILLVHGFPETWWAFRKVIPLLAESHRVFAIDLPGIGDSALTDGVRDSAAAAEMLHGFIAGLNVGRVHITAQDISGALVFRVASTHPDDIRSVTAIETGIPGFGWEALADLAHGGAWQIGVLAAPGIPEMLLTGREREFIGGFAFPAMTAVPGAIDDVDIEEFTRAYSGPHGFRGAAGLYRSLLGEGEELRALAAASPLRQPVLAVGAGGGGFTNASVSRAVAGPVRAELLEGVGHYAALEAPERLVAMLTEFIAGLDEQL